MRCILILSSLPMPASQEYLNGPPHQSVLNSYTDQHSVDTVFGCKSGAIWLSSHIISKMRNASVKAFTFLYYSSLTVRGLRRHQQFPSHVPALTSGGVSGHLDSLRHLPELSRECPHQHCKVPWHQ